MIKALFKPIAEIFTLKPSIQQALSRLNLCRVCDLLLYQPSYYKQKLLFPPLHSLKHDDEVILKIKVIEISMPHRGMSNNNISYSSKKPVQILGQNETGNILLVFFNFLPYLRKYFHPGAIIYITGKVDLRNKIPQISHPEIVLNQSQLNNNGEVVASDAKVSKQLHYDQAGVTNSSSKTSIEPIYPLTYAITNTQLINYISKAITYLKAIPEWLPSGIIQKYQLVSFHEAICRLHLVKSNSSCVTLNQALLRLKIDELFANQISLKMIRNARSHHTGRSFTNNEILQKEALAVPRFTLTKGQEQALLDIHNDQYASVQMMRMLQGDVGCGKTLVALLSALNIISMHGQVALMAPTDILAQQHHQFFVKVLSTLGFKTVLLTGKIKGRKRNEIMNEISLGTANVIIGTHALFQEKIIFQDLAYIIIDEQHRFGVQQRSELINKGNKADVLIMSATPIPRSLTIALFGDMAYSTITELPTGRKPITTYTASIDKLENIQQELKKKLLNEEQVYWICPLIESSVEDNENQVHLDASNYNLGNIEDRYHALSALYPSLVGLLHGKLPAEDKARVMQDFKQGKIKILVSTTVVEVGVDVPEASLIIIENAEKFGLAQLHQLRGRVGRGSKASTCILLYGKQLSNIAFQRLKIIRSSLDGFYIAEQDLKLRGGGELLGAKQSGEQNFKFANLQNDLPYLLTTNNFIEQHPISFFAANINISLMLSIFNKNINNITMI